MTTLPDETITPQPWLAVPRAHPIQLIVIHATRGDTTQDRQYMATKNWLLSPNNNQGGWGGATNRIISHEGQMCVSWPDDMSPTYSAGFGFEGSHWSVDWYAISFELAQRNFTEDFAEATLARAAKEVALLCSKYSIPPVWLDRVNQAGAVPTGITGHENTDNGRRLGKTDPGSDLAAGGKFDAPAFIQRVLAEMAGMPASAVAQPATPAPTAAAATPGARQHEVAGGDNLFRIAVLYYQDGARWPQIYAANRAKIGDDPTKIRLGMILEIPA
jgi:hypothetical protein